MRLDRSVAVIVKPVSDTDRPARRGATLHPTVIPTRSGGIPRRSRNSGRPDTATRGMSRKLDVTGRIGGEGTSAQHKAIDLTREEEVSPC